MMRSITERKSASMVGILVISVIFGRLSPASAASIMWGKWTLNPAVVSHSTYAAGSGMSHPHVLQANALASATVNPSSWGDESARTSITLSNFFTVLASPDEQNGTIIPGRLFGNLYGSLYAAGLDVSHLTGSYNSSVVASVNAGFASWDNSLYGDSLSGSVGLIFPVLRPVYEPFDVPGLLTIGQTYPFLMTLITKAQKTGIYQSYSAFNSPGYFYATVLVPEPTTWTLMLVGIGCVGGAMRGARDQRRLAIV